MKLSKIYKKFLFALFIVLISCVIWSFKMKVFQFDKINGSFEKSILINLNVSNWLSGDFQKSLEEYVVLNNHLSPLFVRIHNQFEYAFFNTLHMDNSVVGKENYLFANVYIDAYYGRDFIGEDSLRIYVKKIKFIQDTLKKLNKEFIYIQALGKASFYPEYIPDQLKKGNVNITNYFVLKKLLDEYKVDYINFRPYLLAAKDTSRYPLFTQPGTHWSKYAMAFVMDSINNFIEQRRQIDLPELYWTEVEIKHAQNEDNDLASALNLLFPFSTQKYAYPKLKFESHANKDTPQLLMVGDSYFGNLYEDNFYCSFDSTSQFWFYNTSVSSLSFPAKLHKYQLNQLEVLKSSDIVILGCTEHNIKGRSWNFIDDLYGYYKYGNTTSQHEISFMKKVDSCKALANKNILSESEIREIAETQHVSIDSATTIKWLWQLQTKLH